MDKNFTVDDIINEYSGRTTGRKVSDESLDLDGIIKSLEHREDEETAVHSAQKLTPKTELIEDVLEIGSNKYAVDDISEPAQEEPSESDDKKHEHLDDDGVYPQNESKRELSNTEIISRLLSTPALREKSSEDKNSLEQEDFGLRHAKETQQGTDVMERVLDEEQQIHLSSDQEPFNREHQATYDNGLQQGFDEQASRVDKSHYTEKEPERVPLDEKPPEHERITPVEESVKHSEPGVRPIKENGANTAIMEGLLKLKKERGTVKHRDPKVDPVNRATIDNVELDIDSKILPNTEIGLDKNATEEERLAYLNAKRRERVKQFVISGDDEEEEPKKEEVADFESFEQAHDMASSIASLKASLVVRLCVLLIASVVSSYVAIANDLGLPLIGILSKAENQGMPYLFVNVVIGLMACFVSYTVLAVGLKKLFTLKADSDTLAAVAAVLSIGSGIALLTDTELVQLSVANVYISAAVIGLLVNTFGKLLIVVRTERNFEYVSGGYSKYAVMHIDDEDVASKFTKGALTDFPSLTTSRKTEFVCDFIKNSYSADMTDSYCRYFVPIITLISLIVGVITAFLHPAEVNTATRMLLYGLSCAAGTYALCSCAGMMLVTNIPLAKGSRKYMQQSAVMLGYSAVDKFADTNSILIDAVDLFPDGMVEIINIKPTKKTPIEDGIIYAASLCCQTESILRPTFYKMIKGKTEMLFPVESYIYEDGLGLSGWIQNKRVLFGNRALMEAHSIDGLPTAEKEAQYIKDDTSLQYLSIGGSLAMIFVVKLKASVTIAKALKDCENQNLTVILRSVDSLLSITRIAELFGVAPNMFKLLPFRHHSDYDACTSYIEKMSSPMIYSGHFSSLAMLLIGTKRLQKSAIVGVAIQTLSAVLGVILAVVLALVGIFSEVLGATAIIAYIMVFVLITAIVQLIART